MDIFFDEEAWDDFEYWIETDKSILIKIKDLLRSIIQTPFKGLGKPEPLKHKFKGYWSRRITQEHRLVYKISGKKGKDQICASFFSADTTTTINNSNNASHSYLKLTLNS